MVWPVPGRVESREDAYLLDRNCPGCRVKVRGGRALEVKAPSDYDLPFSEAHRFA